MYVLASLLNCGLASQSIFVYMSGRCLHFMGLLPATLGLHDNHIVLGNITTQVNLGPRPLGPKAIDGLLVPPGKASTLPTDHLITG